MRSSRCSRSETMPTDYVVGLDLGQTQDFTALAVLERQPLSAGTAATAKADFALRHLQRFPLGTPYPAIISAVTTMRKTGPLNGAALIVDQTGVGRAVV